MQRRSRDRWEIHSQGAPHREPGRIRIDVNGIDAHRVWCKVQKEYWYLNSRRGFDVTTMLLVRDRAVILSVLQILSTTSAFSEVFDVSVPHFVTFCTLRPDES